MSKEQELISLLEKGKALSPVDFSHCTSEKIIEVKQWIYSVNLFAKNHLEDSELKQEILRICFFQDKRRLKQTYEDLTACLLSLVEFYTSQPKSQNTLFKDGEKMIENEKKEYDVFISHANKDKNTYVNELFSTIKQLGIHVFYDSDVLSWGDNWKEKILEGTEKSEFAIIVISKNFFGREWTEIELQEFFERQNSSGQKIILPLLYEIDINDLTEKYPFLSEIQCIKTSDYSKEQICILFAKELIKRLKGI